LLTVVVPTWNRAGLLTGALQALGEQTVEPPVYEILVVDDGSKDDTAGAVQTFAETHPELDVEYVRRPNGGINAARNTGIATARGEIVAFVDDDELAPSGHVAGILENLAAHPEASGTGGPYLDAPHGGVRTCDQCSLGAARLPIIGAGNATSLLGGNMALRRTALEAVGPFAESLSGRADELEWFSRAGTAGHRFWYDQSLFIWHRRDTMSLLDMCRSQFRQGRSLPRSFALMGDPWRPRPVLTARYVVHGVRRRCGKGFILASRDAGSLASWLGLRLKR